MNVVVSSSPFPRAHPPRSNPVPAVLIRRAAVALHHAIDGDLSHGRQLHERGSFALAPPLVGGLTPTTNASVPIRHCSDVSASGDAPAQTSGWVPDCVAMSGPARSTCVPRLLILALALMLLAPGRADAKVACNSGKTLYQHGRTRVFTMYQRTEFYACSAVVRRPRLFAYGNDGSLDDLYSWKPFGHRLSFIRELVGGDNLGWSAGWVDLRTGASAEATIQPDHGIPFAVTGQAVVVAARRLGRDPPARGELDRAGDRLRALRQVQVPSGAAAGDRGRGRRGHRSRWPSPPQA